MNHKIYNSLNGLRSLACLGIVAMHVAANMSLKPTNNFIQHNFLSFTGNFVLLFMMVSAFSMCCGYLERFQNGSISLNDFYKKRYKRILPFFALLTVIDVIKCLVENHFSFSDSVIGELWEAFANLTLVFGLAPGNDISVVGVGWFLGVIFLFYMLFPFFSVLLENKRRAWIAFVVSIIWALGMRNYFGPIKGALAGSTCMLVVAPYFLVGGITYLYTQHLKSLAEKKIPAVLSKVVIILYTTIFFIYPESRFLYSNLLLYTFWLIYAVMESKSTRKWTLLNNKVMTFISGISMEIYLAHMMIFRVVEKIHLERFIHNNDALYWSTLALVLLGAIILASCWKKIEKRYIR